MKQFINSISFIVFLVGINSVLYAQAPANDDCENADEIKISNKGFDFGTYISGKFKIDNAGKQKGEKCAKELEDNGNCDKTVWFKFYIPTTRNISIKLTQQDSAIPQIFAGFNVYKVKDCDYSQADLALNLTPLNKFGESGNTCLTQGWYYIQVGCKQKAKGELWMELTSAAQSAQLYDKFNQPYDFGVVKDQRRGVDLITTCASVEDKEAMAINDSNFSKSVFCKFTLSAKAVYNLVELNLGYYDAKKFKYRVFMDNITIDSVNGNKPFIQGTKNGYEVLLNEFCPDNNSTDRTYYVQLIADNPGGQYCQLFVSNYTYKIDGWNTPNTNDIINTKNGFTRTIDHYYNCEGLLKKHTCKSVIPDSFNYYRTLYNGDIDTTTFKLGGYTILNVSESGTVTVFCKDIYNSMPNLYYSIYKGDITKNCNLVHLASKYVQMFNYCVEPGTYTLLTAIQADYTFGLLKHTVNQSKPVLNTVHYFPKDPEKMGTFVPSAKLTKYSSVINFNLDKDTVIKIDTLTLKGSFIFREFYLSEAVAGITISQNNYNLIDLYVMKGQVSKGNVHLLKGFIYKGGYNFQLPDCGKLDTGYYTVISRIDSSKKTVPCVSPSSALTMVPPSICTQLTYNEAYKALNLNNNMDVLAAAGNKSNLDYVFSLPFCYDCNTTTILKPTVLQFKKQFMYPNSRYSFYTFYLGANAELRLPQMDYNTFELYKGDASQNPGLITDSLNIVSSCDIGNVYCNLKGGTYYTLVLFNISGTLAAYFTPHQVSPNDFASHACDLGHIAANGSKVSPPMPITCHTNGFNSDPCSWENGNKQCLRWANDMIIPYKDTVNVKRQYPRKNIWYTFTVDNSASITVTVSAKTAMLKNPKMNLYRYNGAYNVNFQSVISSQFDSTEKSMEWLATNTGYVSSSSSDNRKNFFTFTNQGCATNRYFILLEDESYYDFAHYEYIITLNYTKLNLVNTGDFCQNAVTANISSYSTNLVTANNICHTYGNSPYESDYSKDIKSAWYKINVSNMKSCDIKIKNTKGKGLLYYNIYGGSCNAMTKIAHLADLYSYFTLSCMGNGTYFIQAVCQRTVNADIEFEVTAIAPLNPNCKPYDFRMPIAQFKMDGGCNNDTLKLINISSIGSAITYSWYINTDYLSSDINPQVLMTDPLVKPKNTIKLIVENTVDNFSDTVSQVFEPDTNQYIFKITGPPFAKCSDTVTLKVNTNFPDKINYSWTDENNKTPVLTKNKTVYNPYNDIKYYVAGESDNCKFSDSFTLRVARTLNRFHDTSLCPGEFYTIYSKKGDNLYVGSQQVIDSFRFKVSDTYYLRYIDKSCQYYDTVVINMDTGIINTVKVDSVYACKTPVKLNYPYGTLKKYKWNTGDSVAEISVDKSGTYNLKGNISQCRTVDYTQILKIDLLNADILQNKKVCKGDTVSFINPYPQLKLILKNPSIDKIHAVTPFREKIVLQKGSCIISDSADISVYIPSGFHIDSPYCDVEGVFSMRLDAGFSLKYLWTFNNSTGRFADIPGFGKYVVIKNNQYSCADTLYFNVFKECSLIAFIPNVFSPNGDLNNELFGPVFSTPIKMFRLQIFNRWGEKLFDEIDKGWNGNYMGENVQQGIYVYMLEVHDLDNKVYYFNGTLTLLH